MASRRALVFSLCALGCGHPATNPPPVPCTFVCHSPHFSTLELLAGQPGGHGFSDGTLSAAHFDDPWTFALGNGHLYVADGQAIRVIDLQAGTVATVAGVYGMPGGVDGVGSQASFNTPSGLALDGNQLYVADTENHTIRKIDLPSGTVTTVGGMFRQPGAVDAVGTAARFQEPEGLALDGSGNLYIADTDNNTLRVMAITSGAVTTLAGTAGMTGADDGTGAAARFYKPRALALDGSGHLFVADSLNQSIRRVDVMTGAVTTLAKLSAVPQGVVFVGGMVWVALADNTVQALDPSAGTATPIAGTSGMPGFVDASAATARFNNPAGLVYDGSTIYLADENNGVIRAITPAGAVTTFAGAHSSGSSDGSGAQARFFAPQGLASDADAVYVADTNNDVIRKVTLAGGVVTTLAGSAGQMGSSDGPGASARFNAPQAIAVSGGTVYVADTGNRKLRRIDLASGNVSTLAVHPMGGEFSGSFNTPAGLAVAAGKLFISDYGDNVIYTLDLATLKITTLAGSATSPGGGDGVGAAASFLGPLGLASDGAGKLYVADSSNDIIRQIDIATATVTTLAGTGQAPGDMDGVGSAALFHYPSGVAADGAGDVWVADTSNNLVRHIDVKSRTVTTLAGKRGLPGVLLGPLPGQLTQPPTLVLTPAGTLIVSSENALLRLR
jgi:sugar lactone lactonase YvrE